MRTEEEMMKLLYQTAAENERIRAMLLEGSRTNPQAPPDILQDYDIAYLVTDMQWFLDRPQWIDVFGPRMILQTPENMAMFPPHMEWFSYLMILCDGVKIDLTLAPVERAREYIPEDGLVEILMDKGLVLPPIPKASDEYYWAELPSQDFFDDCCNEFWLVATYVAKGLWREEILFAKAHMHDPLRTMLLKMLEWQVGAETDASVSIGKCGKYLRRYLQTDDWHDLLSSYSDAAIDSTWDALFASCRLFRRSAAKTAAYLGYDYPKENEEQLLHYLQTLRSLPSDAVDLPL